MFRKNMEKLTEILDTDEAVNISRISIVPKTTVLRKKNRSAAGSKKASTLEIKNKKKTK